MQRRAASARVQRRIMEIAFHLTHTVTQLIILPTWAKLPPRTGVTFIVDGSNFAHVGKRWNPGRGTVRSHSRDDLERKLAGAQTRSPLPIVGRVRLVVAHSATNRSRRSPTRLERALPRGARVVPHTKVVGKQ